MCPLCLSAAAWLTLGGGSAASLAALVAMIRRKGEDNGDDCNDSSDREP
jgi:hypothetical protein